MSIHARLGPSNQRWPNCPGSIREEAFYPDVSGEAAIDGTGSHLLLELCLIHGVRAEAYDRQIIGANHEDNPNGWMVSPDRIDRVQECLDYIEARVEKLKDEFPTHEVVVEAESHSDPGAMFSRDDWNGTVDVTIMVSDDLRCHYIEIIDYKDGRMYVDPKGNTQLVAYLGGKIRKWIASGPDLIIPLKPHKVEKCVLTIVQPKTNPTVRSDKPSITEVITQLDDLSAAASLTDHPEAPLIADGKGGKGYCKWCRHKSNCTAGSQQSIEKVKEMSTNIKVLSDLESVAVADLTTLESKQLVALSDVKDDMMALFTRIDVELERRLDEGVDVPGRAMKPGKGSNVWNSDEEAIAKMLKGRKFRKDDIYPAKLISPAQVLKSDLLTAQQKETIQKEFITYKEGTKKLTKVDVVENQAELMFGDVAPSLFEEPPVSFI